MPSETEPRDLSDGRFRNAAKPSADPTTRLLEQLKAKHGPEVAARAGGYAVGPERGKIRGWRAWGDRPMPRHSGL